MDSRQPGRRAPSLGSRAMWFFRARPVDSMLAMREFYATLPRVGRHLEPVGAITAMGAWGYRHAPDFVSTMIRNRAPGSAGQRRQDREMTHQVAADTLREFVAPERCNVEWPAPDRVAPMLRNAGQRRRYLYRGSVRYGDSPGQVLDVWRRQDLQDP